jgi:ABC-type Fe3+/spermidine/putrescine transport system ATPase subunit
MLKLGDFKLRALAPHELNGAGEALAMIRPENVRLVGHGAGADNQVPGMVEEVVYLGFHKEVRVRLATGVLVKVDVPNDADVRYAQGDPVDVELPGHHLQVLAIEPEHA